MLRKPDSFFRWRKKPVSTFKEFPNAYDIKTEAVSNIDTKQSGSVISLIPIQIVLREKTLKTIKDDDFKIIVNLHPTDDTH